MLPVGSYRVRMTASDDAPGAEPVLETRLRIASGRAVTAVAHGRRADIRVDALADDLSRPATGSARLRVAQMSTLAPRIDVATSTGVPIATDAPAGEATRYVEVPAGPWTLLLGSDGGSRGGGKRRR